MRLLTKKLGILGYGREGKSLEKFLQGRNVRDLQVFDEKLSEFPDFSDFGDREVLMRSPGVPLTHPALQNFKGQIIGTLELFLNLCATKKIIGITGTKGKGTSATLLHNIFSEANDTVYLLGNIGIPFFDEVTKIRSRDFVVAELSSFQLWDTPISPQVAVLLAITPDHLDTHTDFDEYLLAKRNILAHQRSGGRVLYNADCPHATELAEELIKPEQRWAFSTTQVLDKGMYLDDGNFVWRSEEGAKPEVVCSQELWQMRGEFNLVNALAAIATAKLVNVRNEPIETALQKWRGLPGRLQLIARHPERSVSFWNDTQATVPLATLGAVQSFTEPLILVAGGKDKGADFTVLAELAKQDNLKRVLLIGETAAALAKIFGKKALVVKDLAGVKKYLLDNLADEDHVLLSPACSSFDQFENIYDRGQQWQDLANEILREL